MTTPVTFRLSLTTASELGAVDRERRTMAGRILTFGVVGNTSAGPTRFLPGSVEWTDPKRVKLIREHDRENPVGLAGAITVDSDGGLSAMFRLPEGAAGDLALEEAANGLRDGLSVGVEVVEATKENGVLVVKRARLRECSQVAIPAFDDCRITDVAASSPEQPTDPAPEPTPDDAGQTPDVDTAPTGDPDGGTMTDPTGATAAPAPDVTASAPAPSGAAASSTPRPLDLTAFCELVAASATGTLDAQGAPMLRAALSDIVPADAGEAYFQPTYLDELWDQAGTVVRPMIDAFTTKPLGRTMKIKAFRWVTRPEVDDYAGNKAEVPSNEVALEPLEVPVTRTAGAHDIDRAYIDLGSPDFLAAYFAAMTEDYKRKTEAKFAAFVLANAPAVADENGAVAGQVGTLLDGILAGAIELLGNGHTPSVVAVGAGMLRDLFGITRDEAPAFMQGTISLARVADQRLGDLSFTVSPGLTGRNIVVGAKSAATFWEANPPVKVQALDVAHGGVDAGVFGYHAMGITNTLAVRKIEVAP